MSTTNSFQLDPSLTGHTYSNRLVCLLRQSQQTPKIYIFVLLIYSLNQHGYSPGLSSIGRAVDVLLLDRPTLSKSSETDCEIEAGLPICYTLLRHACCALILRLEDYSYVAGSALSPRYCASLNRYKLPLSIVVDSRIESLEANKHHRALALP